MSATPVFKGLIFDLDGTLTDHPSVLGGAFAECLKKYGKKISVEEGQRLAKEMQLQVAGIESTFSYIKVLNKITKEQGIGGFFRRLRFIRNFIKIFHAFTRKTKMFSGIPELLQMVHARGMKICIVTSSSRSEVNRSLTEVRDQFDPYVDAVITRDDIKDVKPNPASLFVVTARFGLEISQCLVVGDSWHDIRAAKNAGARSAAVLWGYGTLENLSAESPDFIVKTPQEILEILAQKN
ncbi:MAG: pyrophosphatase [Promethearchaeota archaeon CR_4]|nr:MAG: pyrophosphatase [Candidatus Lokiarchaeota archaeon CR_4]